jgi:beta-glucosidase
LYIRDDVASVSPPVKQLKDFRRISLLPGECQVVRFELPARQLAVLGPDFIPRVEPGTFTLWIGPDSTRGLEGRFEIRA